MNRLSRSKWPLLALGVLAWSGVAWAEDIGASGKWLARTHVVDGKTLCFAISAPQQSQGDIAARGPVGALVTHLEGGAERDQVSVVLGYRPKAGTLIRLSIDGKAYILRRIEGERAWARDDAGDRLILSAMKRGNRMVVTGTSEDGHRIEDTFSLAGITRAVRMAAEACGIN